jgi:DNA-directed RNA polymerase subunit RPC12/RpoP
MGRILERPLLAIDGMREGRERVYRCADCGLERDGLTPAVLCTCGLKVRGRHIGMRCEANLERSPEFSAEIIARQA